MDLLEILILTFYSAKDKKTARLAQANIQLEKIRYFTRLAFEIGCLSSGKYKELSEQNQELGRMVGGWIKSLHPAPESPT